MAVEPKVRPSLTQADMQVLADACQHKLNAHLAAGDYRNPVILQLDKLNKYCLTFVKQEETMADLFAKFVAMQGNKSLESSVPSELIAEFQESLVTSQQTLCATTSLESVVLTDEQRYDMLKLKPTKQYSEDDKVFFLNKGTLIEMQRKLKSNEPIGSGDL